MIISQPYPLWAAWTDGDHYHGRIVGWHAHDDDGRPELAPLIHGHDWDVALPPPPGVGFTLYDTENAARCAAHGEAARPRLVGDVTERCAPAPLAELLPAVTSV